MKDIIRLIDDDVESRTIYIPSKELNYFTPSDFLPGGEDEKINRFDKLPKIAQTHFRDAGKCLTYGLAGASISLALQATEAALRYYAIRHGCPPEQIEGWSNMYQWLSGSQRQYLPQKGGELVNLEKLGSYYRNLVAHGRAYFERGREEAELAEAERIFAACRDAALMLTKSYNNQTSIAIQIHHEIDFDMVVATYLYRWNPEFPPITIDAFRFDHQTKGELLDSTFDASAPLKRVANASLSDTIVKHMQIDKKYVPLLGDLLNCVRTNPEFPLGPSTNRNPRTNLERIYYNDYWSIYKDDPPKLLLETGKMLDKLTQRGLHPNAPHLARELE